jgi:serine/threonine protein kinase
MSYKGEFIDGGASGLVQRLSPTRVVKTPWAGFDKKRCREDLDLEAKIYQLLGPHPRLVEFFSQDPLDGAIVLEYMPNGTLRKYLEDHHQAEITPSQRLRWAREVTEGLGVLHAIGAIHCDFSPKNFLLDEGLGVKISDFGACSLHGSSSSGMGSVRFLLRYDEAPTVLTDLFSLGSSIYEIMTGRIPYGDVESHQVMQLYALSQFPDLTGVRLGDVIRSCWLLQVNSTEEVLNMLPSTIY